MSDCETERINSLDVQSRIEVKNVHFDLQHSINPRMTDQTTKQLAGHSTFRTIGHFSPKTQLKFEEHFCWCGRGFEQKATNRAVRERFSESPKGHNKGRFPYLKTSTRRLVTPQQFSAPWPLCPFRLRGL